VLLVLGGDLLAEATRQTRLQADDLLLRFTDVVPVDLAG
jgi:hypothetical protein